MKMVVGATKNVAQKGTKKEGYNAKMGMDQQNYQASKEPVRWSQEKIPVPERMLQPPFAQ